MTDVKPRPADDGAHRREGEPQHGAPERRLEEDFLRIWADRGLSVLMVTHDVRKALRMADRVLVLSARPATVRAEYRVPLARPRPGPAEFDPEFLSMERRLCEEITSSADGLTLSDGRLRRRE